MSMSKKHCILQRFGAGPAKKHCYLQGFVVSTSRTHIFCNGKLQNKLTEQSWWEEDDILIRKSDGGGQDISVPSGDVTPLKERKENRRTSKDKYSGGCRRGPDSRRRRALRECQNRRCTCDVLPMRRDSHSLWSCDSRLGCSRAICSGWRACHRSFRN